MVVTRVIPGTHHDSAFPKNAVFIINLNEFESTPTPILFNGSYPYQWILCGVMYIYP